LPFNKRCNILLGNRRMTAWRYTPQRFLAHMIEVRVGYTAKTVMSRMCPTCEK